MLGTKARVPQCSQAQGVGGVVGKVKTALDGQAGGIGIVQPCLAGALQAGKLPGIRRFGGQWFAGAAEVFKR